jgi:HAD superfamily hydrolase (TIGR01484 family)
MDGTLLNNKSQVSREKHLAIERFVSKGGKFTVATGRMEASVRPYVEKLPINAPAIHYNGSMIFSRMR